MKPEDAPLRSVHTTNFPAILQQLGISLLVSTYQAGKLIVVRADSSSLNTHFRAFDKPMGMAATRERIALGTTYRLWELRNIPAVAQKLPPAGKHDACYLPRAMQVTGDIDIHEMAWAGEELWFVNTRFSCLCTPRVDCSFVPRWRPPFISAYDLTDRCHLNGLAVKGERPKYVTALGTTDRPGGWRDRKADGGILMDVETNEILLQGLSMPHSPRWYNNKLWLLESGRGSLSWVDLAQRRAVAIAELPGFTRGLDFYSNLAFVGLSQVRESAVFSGIPLTKTLAERICGIWVVDIRNGNIIAFLRFEEAVQEIFAISVLPGIRFPEIIDWDEGLLASSYTLPDEALANTIMPKEESDNAQTHFRQGNEQFQQQQWQDAIAAFRQCLELQPDHLPARFNLGVALHCADQNEEAIIALQQVIAAEASHAEAHHWLGCVLKHQRRFDNAIACYEQALNLRPKLADAHYHLAMTLLTLGEWERGWAEYEWRWQTAAFTPFTCPQPRWDGSNLPDKTLLIHTEQSESDAIQFARFIPLAAQRCGQILLVCAPELEPFFASVEGCDRVRTPGNIPLAEFDAYIPLLSLPHLLGTTLETLPAVIPYLKAGKTSSFNITNDNVQVGIVWNDGSTLERDRHHSCALTDLLPLLQLPELEFYSLQTGERSQDITQLPLESSLQDLSPLLQDYSEAAALIEQLDLIISVDGAIAHLAGALGKPVWMLLSHNAHWRWLRDRNDSPWYPTLRLFRQPHPGDWGSVIEQVKQSLQQQPN